MNLMVNVTDDRGKTIWAHGHDSSGRRCGIAGGPRATGKSLNLQTGERRSLLVAALELALEQAKFEVGE